jgi:signal recognition particle subunit SRP19
MKGTGKEKEARKEPGAGKKKGKEVEKPERILYPCYFDAGLERGQGRRVPRGAAVKGPTMEDLERAVKRCGIKHHREPKSHPAHWFKREGRIVAEWTGTKETLLRKVAGKLEVKP